MLFISIYTHINTEKILCLLKLPTSQLLKLKMFDTIANVWEEQRLFASMI